MYFKEPKRTENSSSGSSEEREKEKLKLIDFGAAILEHWHSNIRTVINKRPKKISAVINRGCAAYRSPELVDKYAKSIDECQKLMEEQTIRVIFCHLFVHFNYILNNRKYY